jgi:hypothetical protein
MDMAATIAAIVSGVAVACITGVIAYLAKIPSRREFDGLKDEVEKLRKENNRLWADRDGIAADISDVSKQNKDFRAKVAENYVAKRDLKTLVKGIMADSSGD